MKTSTDRLFQFVRFNIVGILATACYFCVGMALELLSDLTPVQVHLCAFGVSIVLSYLGHSRFTFGVSGRRYLIRFIVITAILFGSSTLLTRLLSDNEAVPQILIVGIVTVAYTVASFLLHSLWTFTEPRSQ